MTEVAACRRRAARRSRHGLLPTLLLAAAALAASDEAGELLMRMNMAVEGLNYEGTLLHMAGGEPMLMRIVHRVDGDEVSERITALDGPGREILRNNDEVTCILPDERSVLVEPRDIGDRSQSPLQGSLPRSDSLDPALYRLRVEGRSSAAGKAARILTIEPRDLYRYGYRLWLDEATGMPLKAQLRGQDGGVVEQIMFTEIEIRDRIPPEAVKASLDTSGYRFERATESSPPEQDNATPGWRADRLPPGFRRIAARARLAPGAKLPTEQFVYSDGLATVSVFVDMGPPANGEREGLSRMGATNAYTAIVGDYLVTAVGEVPPRTVEMMATGMRRAE